MRFLGAVRAVSIFFTGLAAGIFLGHRMGVSMAMPELPPSSFVQLQQIIHVYFARMMPVLVIGATVALLVWTILLWTRRKTAEFWLVAGSFLAMVCAGALTRAVNIPINEQLMSWNIEAPPPNLMELWSPWEKVHTIRTALAIAAFLFQTAALTVFASSAAPPKADRQTV